MIQILHISDLHFFSPSLQSLFEKAKDHLLPATLRTYGNFTFNPYRYLKNDLLDLLARNISQMPANTRPAYILNTGDLTAIGSESEFKKAQNRLSILQKRLPDAKQITLAGNHDFYTRRSTLVAQQLYSSWLSPQEAKSFYQTRLSSYSLDKDWELILLDLSPQQAHGKAFGVFEPSLAKSLETKLQSLKSKNILIAAHWPFTAMHKKANELQGKEHLEKILSSFPQVKGYMHGHTHHPSIAVHTFASGSQILCAEPGPFGARSYEPKNFFSKRRFPLCEPRAHMIELDKRAIRVSPILLDHEKGAFYIEKRSSVTFYTK